MSFSIQNVLVEEAVNASVLYIDSTGGGGGGVQSVSGTANQITASGTTNVSLSLPTDVEMTNLTLEGLKLTTGAGADLVLTSDADGNASWQVGGGGLQNVYGTANEITATPNGADVTLSLPSGISVGSVLDTTGNATILAFQNGTGSNYVNVSNSNTTPTISTAGTSTDIDLLLSPKNAGVVSIPRVKFPTNPAANYVLTSDASGNGTWQAVPASGVQSVGVTANQTRNTGTSTDPVIALTDSVKIVTGLLDANSANMLKFNATASAANYLTIANAISGTSPTFSVTGTDSNIDLTLAPRGSGVVSMSRIKITSSPSANYVLTSDASGNGTWQAVPASGVQSVGVTANQTRNTGTSTDPVIALTDSVRIVTGLTDTFSNSMLVFSATASAENYFNIANAVSGASPTLRVSGPNDANIDLTLAPKGSGVVSMSRIKITTSPSANYVLTSDASGNGTWQAVPASGVQSVGVTANQTRNTGTSTDPVIALTDSVKIVTGFLDSNSNNILVFSPTASAANYLTIANAISGASPTFSVTGTDSNIDLTLAPRGSGVVSMSRIKITTSPSANYVLTSDASGNGTWQAVPASGVQSITGAANQITIGGTSSIPNISMTDSVKIVTGFLDTNSNNMLVFRPTASAANYLTIANAISGASPTFSVTGTDSNIDLTLAPRGSGVVSMSRIKITSSPSANYVLTSDASGNGTWQPNVKSISGTTNEIDVSGTNDVTLSLPNNVRISSSILDSNDNIMIAFSPVTNADSYFAFRNRLGDGSLIISATGAANNLNLTLAPKGTGVVSMPRFQLTTGAVANYVLTSDASGNGTWQAVPASGVQSVGVTANQTQNVGTATDPIIALTDDVKIVSGLLDSNSNEMLAFSATASAANYITIANAISGASPTFSVTGTDSNIDLTLAPRGSGVVSMPSKVFLNTLQVNNGVVGGTNTTIATFSEMSNAVNYINISNNVSGSAPVISSDGVTSDVNLQLSPKGSGTVIVPRVRITQGAVANYVLTSDASGNGTWQAAAASGVQSVGVTANQTRNTGTSTDPVIALTDDVKIVSGLLDSNSNEMLMFSATGSATNYITITNATNGASPTLSAAGPTDANIDLTLAPKGSGVVSMPSKVFLNTLQVNNGVVGGTNTTIATFSEISNAVNYINISNNVSGSAPVISSDGVTSDVNLQLSPKGSGTVIVPRVRITQGAVANYVLTSDASGNGTWQAAAASGVQSVGVTANQTRNTGTSTDPVIALTDSVKIVQGLLDTNSNNMLAFSATLSAANYLTIANAASGSSPTLSATGGNPNIDIVLAPQGSGRVEMSGIRVTSATPITANWVLTTDASGNGTWQASNSLSPFVVGSGCTYTTIQSAVTAAQVSGGNIYIKPGTYTENLTLYDNINLIGFAEYNALNDVSHSNVIINGNITIASSAVDVNLQGLLLNTSSGSVISFTNTNSSEVYLYNCAIQQTAVDGIFDFPTGVGGIVRMERCAIFSSSSPFVTDAGGAGGIIFSVLNSEITLGALFTISQNFTLTLKNSTFENDTYDMTLDGSIQIISIIQSIFTSNIVSTGSTNSFNMSKTTFTGIFINTQSSLSSNNVSISDCTINGNIDFGTSAGGTTNITFKNCTMYQSLSNYTLSVGDSSTTINVYDSIMQIITMSRRDTTVTSTINAYNSQFNGSIIDDTTLTNTFNFTNCFLTNFNFGSLTSIEQVKTTNLYNCTQGLGVVNKFCGQGLINSGTSTVQASITTTGPSATAELCAISVPAYNGNNQMIYYKAVVQGKLKDTGSPVVSNVIAGTAFGVYYNDGTTLSLIGNTADYSIKKTASGASGGDIILVIGSSLMIPYVALQVTSPSTVGSGVDFQWVAQVTYQYL